MKQENTKNFAQNWLETQCQSIEGICCALFLLVDNKKKGLKPVAQWPLNSKDPEELIIVSRLAIKNHDSVINSKANPDSPEKKIFDYLASPIYVDKHLMGIIAVKTIHQNQQRQQEILNTLKIGTKWLAIPEQTDKHNDQFYLTTVKLAVNCLQQDTVHKVFSVLINDLTSEFSCERVSVGEVNNHHIKVIALSNSAKFDDKSNLIRTISAAMDEAVDQDRITVYPEPENGIMAITNAHAELARKFGSGAICTIPFVYDESVFAVLTMERSESKPFDLETQNICEQTLALISPFLKLKHDSELLLIEKLGVSTKKTLKDLFGFQYLQTKIISHTPGFCYRFCRND